MTWLLWWHDPGGAMALSELTIGRVEDATVLALAQDRSYLPLGECIVCEVCGLVLKKGSSDTLDHGGHAGWTKQHRDEMIATGNIGAFVDLFARTLGSAR